MGIKPTNKWVTGRGLKVNPFCWFNAHLTVVFSLRVEHNHRTKKRTRNRIKSQKRTKTYPRNRRPENQTPCHLTRGRILQRRTTESMGVCFIPLHLQFRESGWVINHLAFFCPLWLFIFSFSPGAKSPGKMPAMHYPKGDSNFGKMRPFRRPRYFDNKVRHFICIWLNLIIHLKHILENIKWDFILFFFQPFINMNVQRRPRWLIPPEEV